MLYIRYADITLDGGAVRVRVLKATTLLDYEKGEVPDPREFFEANRRLEAESYRSLIVQAYGPPESRAPAVKAMVNEAVLLYLTGERRG